MQIEYDAWADYGNFSARTALQWGHLALEKTYPIDIKKIAFSGYQDIDTYIRTCTIQN